MGLHKVFDFFRVPLFLSLLSAPLLIQAKTFVIPHVLEKSGTIANTPYTFDTVLFASYTGERSTGAENSRTTVELYLYDQRSGLPIGGRDGAAAQPYILNLSTTNRHQEIRFDQLLNLDLLGRAGVQEGFAVVVVKGDEEQVALETLVINSHTGPADLSVFGFEPQPIAAATQARVQARRTFVIPHVLDTKGSIKISTNAIDTTLYANYVGGLAGIPDGGGAELELYLYDDQTGLAVCNPCRFRVNAQQRALTIDMEELLAKDTANTNTFRTGYGIVVVGGADPNGVNLQGFVVNSHTSAFDLSVFGFDPQEVKVESRPTTRKTYVIPHVLETSGSVTRDSFTFDTTVVITYTPGLAGLPEGNGASVDLYLYDEKGAPLRGANNAVCNPCTFPLGKDQRKQAIDIGELIAKQGGGFLQETVTGYGVAVVNGDVGGVNLQTFVVNSHTGPLDLSVFGSEPQRLDPVASARYVIPHILESSGKIAEKQNTFDTTIFITYARSDEVPSQTGSAKVSLHLYDRRTGEPMRVKEVAICNPCTFELNATHSREQIRIQDLIDAAGGFDTEMKRIYATVSVEGDAANVNLQGFVVNSHSGPLDLSVFGFEPQEIKAPALIPVMVEVTAVGLVGDQLQFSFAASKGSTFALEYKESLSDDVWKTLSEFVGDDSNKTVSETIKGSAQRFYRVRSL